MEENFSYLYTVKNRCFSNPHRRKNFAFGFMICESSAGLIFFHLYRKEIDGSAALLAKNFQIVFIRAA